MNSSCESRQFLKHKDILANIPDDLLHSLRRGSDENYLDTITSLALKPAYTSLVFAYHEEIFVEICSRWVLISRSSGNPLVVLAALARILPLAPHLTIFVRTILYDQASDISQAFSLRRVTGLQEDSSRSIHDDLLTIFRILSFDHEEYASLVAPAQIQLVLGQPEKPTRYLAVRVLCMYLHASDMALEKMINEYIGVDSRLKGDWEGKMIDYAFLDLWESRRVEDMSQTLEENRASRLAEAEYPRAIDLIKIRDLSSTTARVGRVLVPRFRAVTSKLSPIISVQTTTRNLNLLARAYIKSSNVLVTGPTGAGKTSLVRDLARELGENSSMVTLHLNEQTDAKLLVGVYTSDNLQGSFRWHPGVLTKAVTEGRWVFIEDLDRAPPEIMSTLLPLLERRELLIPNRGEYIRAAPGFRLIATIRSFLNGKLELVTPGANMIGFRHWTTVPMLVLPDHELAEVVAHRHPVLASYIGKIIDVYSCLRNLDYDKALGRLETAELTRTYGPRDLFRWCSRLEGLLMAAGVRSGHEPISETTNDYILLETVDCFAGFLPSCLAKDAVVGVIAKELQFPAERVQFCLQTRRPEYTRTDLHIRFGRASLPRQKLNQDIRSPSHLTGTTPFALNDHALRFLESAGAAVNMAEPCLLVGETGTGKTAIIQHLAELVGTKLTVVNLSQQSEAGDLLGGYKPVNMRTLAIPILEEFEDLFKATFSSKRNQGYINTVTKAVAKGHWTRALTFWQEALHNVETSSTFGDIKDIETAPGHPPKKRRVDRTKRQKLKAKWERFGSNVQTFRMHLASGSKGSAFSFVEGNIVKAARYGHWVLLDEINLASSDTLESIAELLSSRRSDGPSLLLAETGNAERIRAHKDFRIFGAMNPATDVGKRDLPAGVRSRFTEIFIEPSDKSFENLVSIIKVYLGSHVVVDVRIPPDIANVYLEVKELAEQNVLVDGSQQKPHFSLRTLTRTLVYAVDISPIYGIRRALYEGFCMSFLTPLSSESANLVVPIIEKYLLGSQRNGRALLSQIPRPPENKAAYVRFKQYWIAQGTSPIEEQPNFIITPFVERNLLNLVRATMTRKFPVLLQGPTSSGKTSMIEYLAKISGNKFVRINNHEHTDLQEYLGTYVSDVNGTLQYKEGVLVRALREGSWVVLDELNLAPTDVLEALNRLLDDNKELLIPETQQVVRPHEDFMLFATQNPPGIYGGRKVLSRAFRNRFIEIHFDDIPEEELETILRQRCRIAPSFCTRIVAVYRRLTVLRQTGRLFEQRNSFATLRDLFRWALRDAIDREQLAINGFFLLAERVRDPDERGAVKEIIEDVMKVHINESLIYNKEKLSQQASLTKLPDSNVVWTKSMCRLYVLITEAFKTNEPVLLVGETGSGKTTICQVRAQHTQTHLHIVNAHQNMETGDLIGSQRPVRNKDVVNSQLAWELAQVLNVSADQGEDAGANISTMLRDYDALSASEKTNIPEERRLRVESSRKRLNALFQWMDGSLVHAMKTGEHFLLDEISLADDSVLERLNSVLEPGRSLFLAEKGTDDAPIIASSGFQFCATMNPGGDYGKKELSPALRNRFTEIWVPSTDEKQEVMEIAHDKLAGRWTTFAEPITAFSAWFSSHYNTISPSVSIRDLLAWILFLNKSVSDDRYSIILHGAATVYIDSLGADPAAKMTIPASEVASERHACLLQLSHTFKHDMVSIYYREPALLVDNECLTIGSFKLNLNHSNWRDPHYSLDTPTTKANLLRIVRALQLPKPILLEGSPGVGKTTLIAATASTIGMPLTRINLSDQTDLMDLFGSDVPLDGAEAGRFGWREAPFLRAMQNGEWVLLDEMNLASQSVLEGLNACLDHRGEVYISELDQNFKRHPRFVLFAAQNPHHQGGGRKGLPSSFVNRFTVVYINEFTLQDQLMICRRAFPTCSDEVLENVTHCITAMSAIFQNDPAIGISGGPWEFNLRDAFRWLQLITSHDALLPAGSAAYYEGVLFLQRLRNPEDVISADRPLRAIMPRVDRAHSLFNLLGTSFLQIGLGLLTKSSSRSCSAPYNISRNFSSLALLESIILCIENRWPCLLVGGSGSGKTDAIMQLANAVGAEVVTIYLNTDMDTMDLIGGYEQADPQRKTAYTLGRVRQCVREATINRLLLTAPSPNCLDALENQLQKEPIGLPDLSAILRDCAAKVPMPEFLSIAHELDCIIKQANEDSRGKFEWIDGILIKALEQGSWLILDNANLCSPSVLDRLNSLLEPNALLSINERHSSDGSALIIKPHPSFRLFMTSDPRHGELSRAMRNRSVELHLPVSASPAAVSELRWTNPSSLSRYQIFGRLDWVSLTEPFVIELATICLDHLSFPDFSLRHQWVEQIDKGLLPLQLHQLPLFSYVVELYDRMISLQPTLFPSIQARYEDLAMSLDMDSEWLHYSQAQTLHPMNNPALVRIGAPNDSRISLGWLGSLFDITLTLCKFEHRLDTLRGTGKTKLASQMSLLEKSFSATRDDRLEPTLPVGALLQETETLMRHSLSDRTIEKVDQDWLHSFERLLSYLNDIADVVETADVDEGVFQTYRAVGKSFASELMNIEALKPVGKAFSRGIERLDESWRLSYGQSMEILWSSFDSATAKSLSELDSRLEVEEISDRLDRIGWSSGASIEQLTVLRCSVLSVSESISRSLECNGSLQEVRDSFDQLEKDHTAAGDSTGPPYFQAEFEGLRQYRDCMNVLGSNRSNTILELLACLPLKQSMHFGTPSHAFKSLSDIANCTGISGTDIALAPVRGSLALCILQKINRLSEVPLRSLDMVHDEIEVLASQTALLSDSLSRNHQRTLNRLLVSMYAEVLGAHENFLDSASLSASVEQLKVYTKLPPTAKSSQLASLLKPSTESPDPSYSHKIVDECFNPSLESLHNAFYYQEGVQTEREATNSALAWVQVFTGCLALYVPDRPFDPAMKPLVERDRHRKRCVELRTKLEALKTFERAFAGQASNLRSQLMQKKLQDLGPEQQIRAIARPPTSNLAALQTVFDGVLVFVVQKALSSDILQSLCEGNLTQKPEVELLRSNIARFISRLTGEFRAYDDMTNPLVGMLRGLDAGLGLVILAHSRANAQRTHLSSIHEPIPFLGMKPNDLHRTRSKLIHDKDPDSRFMYLQMVALSRTVTGPSEDNITSLAFQTFHVFYTDWKQQLSESQRENASRSSLYKYRGIEEDQEEGLTDVVEMFSDGQPTLAGEGSRTGSDPRAVSQSLARLQREIFKGTQSGSQRILSMLKDAAYRLGNLPANVTEGACHALPTERLLPACILVLDDSRGKLEDHSVAPTSYNFYCDANLAEVRKLVALLRRIQEKFVALKEAWPEHATIDDVLKIIHELLNTRHIEPLARLLTKTEQLHHSMHEWQMVSSREYSAVIRYDQLTDLLISWRRLELSTWARLLEMEDERCVEDVRAWWFIAYEVVVAAPLSMIHSGQEIQPHAERLLDTLAEFLRTTSMGHYVLRLQLIECFVSHVELLGQELEPMQFIANALKNFMSFYTRYNAPVQDLLQQGRQVLEKDMKEILLLASWKDTNVNALRDSAKRYHHKLFKVIRKYRALLAQPAETVLQRDLPDTDKVQHAPEHFDVETIMPSADPVALRVCQDTVPGWAERAPRFKDPATTATRMAKVTKAPASNMDGAVYLDNYTSLLVESIKALQTETPATMTKDNKKLVKYLRTRKRKLLTDTLKDVRQMGFKENLNEKTLTKQASLSKIFAHSPAINGHGEGTEIDAAKVYLNRLFEVMPRIRANPRNYSEDLSYGEISRSVGYLESMLFVILRQRTTVAASLAEHEQLAEAIGMMESVWMAGQNDIRRVARSVESRHRHIMERLEWLPSLLEAGHILLEKHGNLSGIDNTIVLESIAGFKQNISKLLITDKTLPKLPEGLSSSTHDRVRWQAEHMLERLRAGLKAERHKNPQVAFILEQIGPWSEVSIVDVEESNGLTTIDFAELDGQVSRASDSILAAVQRVMTAMGDIPTSQKDAAWLTRTDKSLSQALKCFHVGNVVRILNDVMRSMRCLPVLDGEELKAASASIAVILPIVRQFSTIQQGQLRRYTDSHRALCKLASILAQSLYQLVSQGFCTPAEVSKSQAGKTEKLEGGTGLGEGEGAEDISKDVQDDEDLSELAQEGNRNQDRKDINQEEDAIDMDHDELEGELGDGSGVDDEGISEDGEANDNLLDEETGKVDDLDAGAVDEKLWDGGEENPENAKEGSNSTGKLQNDEQMAGRGEKEDEKIEGGSTENDNNLSEDDIGEAEEVARGEAEKLDSHVKEEGHLDLPDEIAMDRDDHSTISDFQESDEGGDFESDEGGDNVDLDAPEEKPGDDETSKEGEDPSVQQTSKIPEATDDDTMETNDVGSPLDTEPEDNGQDKEARLFGDKIDDTVTNLDLQVPSDAQGEGQDHVQDHEDRSSRDSGAKGSEGDQPSTSNRDDRQAAAAEGELGQREENSRRTFGDDLSAIENTRKQAFKKLGDALEKWHRQQQQIRDASGENGPLKSKKTEKTDKEVEHLQDENAEADTQALGAATEDQAHALDQRALDTEMREPHDDFLPDEPLPETLEDQEDLEETSLASLPATRNKQARPSAFIGPNYTREPQTQALDTGALVDEDAQMSEAAVPSPTPNLPPSSTFSSHSPTEARRLWSHYETLVHPLALNLTEQLRLILTPTQATKMRGDFRTGKRLNIKRVIPYIASNYKRDKIWLRRSTPQRRNYQVMLAVDDSKSMGESGSGQLAFEALVLVSKSLSMLEVGEICVVGFGDDVKMVHGFEKPFSSEAGINILQHLGFKQTKTNVRKLISESITLFREAKAKALASSSSTELWQLLLIMSDGLCEDHDDIRRLVRQAQEEKIMIVFVIVDGVKGESILNMSQAIFEDDPTSDGGQKLKINRYLEGFPLMYYLVVGDVKELPGVLATALRQWFSEVVGQGG